MAFIFNDLLVDHSIAQGDVPDDLGHANASQVFRNVKNIFLLIKDPFPSHFEEISTISCCVKK